MNRVLVFSIMALVCFGLNQTSFAQNVSNKDDQRCSKSLLNLVAKHLGYNSFVYEADRTPRAEEVSLVAAGACKVWPINNTITIVAIAYENGEYIAVLMIDDAKKKVLATYQNDNSGGMRRMVHDLRIDTARYDLTPDIRAFGVDITAYYGSNCGDGYPGPARTLFVPNDKELRPVLEEFYIWTSRFIKGGDPRCVGPEAAAETEQEHTYYTIGIGKTITNGYANLAITATSSNPAKKPSNYELRYDGKKYRNIH